MLERAPQPDTACTDERDALFAAAQAWGTAYQAGDAVGARAALDAYHSLAAPLIAAGVTLDELDEMDCLPDALMPPAWQETAVPEEPLPDDLLAALDRLLQAPAPPLAASGTSARRSDRH